MESDLGLKQEKEEEYNAYYEKLVKSDFSPRVLKEAKRTGKSIPETTNLMLSQYESRHQEDCEIMNRLKLDIQKWKDVALERSEYIVNEGIQRATSTHPQPCKVQDQKGPCKQSGPNTVPPTSKILPENHPKQIEKTYKRPPLDPLTEFFLQGLEADRRRRDEEFAERRRLRGAN